MNVTSTNEERSKSQSVKVQFSNIQFINDRQERSSLSRYSPLNLQPEISLSVRFAVRLTSLRSHNGRSCILFTAFLPIVRKVKIIWKLLCYNCLWKLWSSFYKLFASSRPCEQVCIYINSLKCSFKAYRSEVGSNELRLWNNSPDKRLGADESFDIFKVYIFSV